MGSEIPTEEGRVASWWAGDNEEFYRVGPCVSRDAAIAEARSYFGEDCWLHILEAELARWAPPSGSQVIDMMIDNSDELFFEDGFDGMAGTDDEVARAEAELDALLAGWLERHRSIFPTPSAFGWMGAREQIEPEPEPEHESADPTPESSNP